MPKETVASYAYYGDTKETEGQIFEVDQVEVHWGSDAAQVAIRKTYQNTTDHPDTVEFSAPLTRTEINDLIRVLRRARDRVFGKDV